jgi:hypothetical protein
LLSKFGLSRYSAAAKEEDLLWAEKRKERAEREKAWKLAKEAREATQTQRTSAIHVKNCPKAGARASCSHSVRPTALERRLVSNPEPIQ